MHGISDVPPSKELSIIVDGMDAMRPYTATSPTRSGTVHSLTTKCRLALHNLLELSFLSVVYNRTNRKISQGATDHLTTSLRLSVYISTSQWHDSYSYRKLHGKLYGASGY